MQNRIKITRKEQHEFEIQFFFFLIHNSVEKSRVDRLFVCMFYSSCSIISILLHGY